MTIPGKNSTEDNSAEPRIISEQVNALYGLGLAESEEFKFKCSFGLVEYGKPYDSLNQLISLVDKALYRSKDKGGNIVTEHFETISK